MAGGYGQLIDDEDLVDYQESTVVNVTDDVVIFIIATQPGSKPRRYRLAPYGDPAGRDRVTLVDGYAKEYEGAGTGKMCTPIIERITRREAFPAGPPVHDPIQQKIVPKYPAGPRLPRVVHIDKAENMRARWEAAMSLHGQAVTMRPVMVQLEVDHGGTLKPSARVNDPAKPPGKKPVKLEEVGNEPAESPPDDMDDDDSDVVASGPPPSTPPPSTPKK